MFVAEQIDYKAAPGRCQEVLDEGPLGGAPALSAELTPPIFHSPIRPGTSSAGAPGHSPTKAVPPVLTFPGYGDIRGGHPSSVSGNGPGLPSPGGPGLFLSGPLAMVDRPPGDLGAPEGFGPAAESGRDSGPEGCFPGACGSRPDSPPRYPLKKGISSGRSAARDAAARPSSAAADGFSSDFSEKRPFSGSGNDLEPFSSGLPASGGPFILKSIAKVHTAPRESSQNEEAKVEDFGRKIHRNIRCGSWALVRTCADGHTFAKSLDCGREWCEKCRASSHNRRMARWLPKAQKIKEMGYMVVTFPLDRRPRSAAELRKLGPAITGILKRRGFARGLRSWHTQGDKSSRWNPHLNFLMDGGYLSPERIDSIKAAVCGILKTEKIVIYYQYTQSVGKMLHWLKYVTRPTFLKRGWDEEMAEELHNFNRRGSWGTWDGEDAWALPEHEKKLSYYKKIEAGICPTCGKKLEGGHVVPVSDFSELAGWAQIWDRHWQFKGPPENVLVYRLFRDYAAVYGNTGS